MVFSARRQGKALAQREVEGRQPINGATLWPEGGKDGGAQVVGPGHGHEAQQPRPDIGRRTLHIDYRHIDAVGRGTGHETNNDHSWVSPLS